MIKWRHLNCLSRFGSGLNELAANAILYDTPVSVIQGLVEDQYKVFPGIKQVAVFCT